MDTLETYRGNVINKIRSEEEKQELRRTEIQQLVEKRRELDEKLEKQVVCVFFSFELLFFRAFTCDSPWV